MTFDTLFEIFIAEKETGVRPGSLATMTQGWLSLARYVGGAEIEAFGREQARSLMARLLGEGLAVKTVKDRMTLLRQMLRYASAELECELRSTDWGLKYPPAEPRRLKSYSATDMTRLVRGAVRELANGSGAGVPALIALFTGMRLGEVCGLRWGDVDFSQGTVTVRRQALYGYDPTARRCFATLSAPKTRSGYREIPLLPALRQVLRVHGGRHPEPESYVVTNKATPAVPRAVREQYGRFVARCGVPAINFHGLRHTYATRLVEAGGDVKTIAVILGHADVTTTLNLYVHPSADVKRKLARKAFGQLGPLF